jgi:membrane protein
MLIVLVALLGLVGQQNTINTIINSFDQAGLHSVADNIQKPLTNIVNNKGGAGALFGFGLLGSLWAASGYLGAFMRAMNVTYEVEEGRPFWKLRPLQVAVTLVAVLLLSLVLVSLVLTGPVAHAIGGAIGLGSTAVTIWGIVKWPVILVVVMAMIAGLYYIAPNVRQPKFRWVSPGGLVAVAIWVLASALFGVYVANFGSYDKTYGTLGGVISFLVWMWISNLALLFGAEFDAELEREREIKSGVPEERTISLPPRQAPKVSS